MHHHRKRSSRNCDFRTDVMSYTGHLVAGYFRCSEMSSLLDPVFRVLCVTTELTDKTGQVYTLDIFRKC